jgi:hypothetical protein
MTFFLPKKFKDTLYVSVEKGSNNSSGANTTKHFTSLLLHNFSVLSVDLGQFVVINFLLNYKHSNFTAKIGKRKKNKVW